MQARHNNATQQIRYYLLLLFITLFVLPSQGNSLSSPGLSSQKVATGTINQPLPLKAFLVPIDAPALMSSTNPSSDAFQWFQLDLTLSADFSTDWLLAFRRVPYQQLDVYIPAQTKTQTRTFQLVKPGLVRSAPSSDPRTIKLNLASDQQHRLWLKVNASSAKQLAPELWPASLYTLNEYRHYTLSASLQTLMVALLLVSMTVSVFRRASQYLLLTGHLITINCLLLMVQGGVFRWLSWNGDPGKSIAFVTLATMMTALASYLHLYRLANHTPKATLTLIGAILVSAGFMPGFLLTSDNTIPTTPVLILLCLQSSSLAVLHYLLQQRKRLSMVSMNLISGDNTKRRVFNEHLRKHLYQPSASFWDETETKEHILTTTDAAVPDVPSLLLTNDTGNWTITSHHPKAKKQVAQQLPYFQEALMQLLFSDGNHHLHLQDTNKNSYWVFGLHIETDHPVFLLMLPGKYQKEKITWQQAIDISSHAKALLEVTQQTRYWQLQASLDSLTGQLNRNAFIKEAEPLINNTLNNEQKHCCLMFIDIDDFKQINDRFGHPIGDKVLSDIAHTIRDSLRQQDLLARYGGEEFVVLLPDTSPWHGAQVAERIRRNVEKYNGGPIPTSISMGLAATGKDTNNLKCLVDQADAAMYQAKLNGKNRFERAPSCRDLRLT